MGKKKSDKRHLSPQAKVVIERQFDAFRRKFGREPGPHDPVFFDPDSATPKPLTVVDLNKQVREAAMKAGVDISNIPEHELFDTLMESMRRQAEKACCVCGTILASEDVGLIPIECLREGSGIGIYFDGWCSECRDRFMDSGCDDEINEVMFRWFESSSPRKR